MVSTTMKLIRRCLLVVTILSVVGCANINQMPSAKIQSKVQEIELIEKINTEKDLIGQIVNTKKNSIKVIETSKQDSLDSASENTQEDKDAKLIKFISDKFLVSDELSKKIFELATKYSHDDFPSRNDILSIIAVESSFRPKAAYRGSFGLMQIEKKSHRKMLGNRNIFNIEVNIELGAFVLNQYYNMLKKNKKRAILGYNIGIGNILKGRYKIEYYNKYLKYFDMISKN